MQKSAVIYARVSTKEQMEEGYSIPSQVALLEQYAGKHNFQISATFADEETARKSGRTQFKQMMSYLKKQKNIKGVRCRTILVEKTDRLYRNFRDYVDLDDFDVEIHLVKEGEVLSRDSRSHVKFIHGIKVLMAKNYSDNLSEEASKGMLEKAKQGHWPSCAPIGYINNPDTRLIEPDPQKAPLVKQAYHWYASGNWSLQEITTRLNEEGLRSKRFGKPMQKGMVQRMLTNPIYYGDFQWKGVLHTGKHKPIISKKLFDTVQQQLSAMSRPKSTKRQFLFSRLIRCGHCGSMVTGRLTRGKYIYYHCTGYKGRCPEKYIREEELDAQFASILKSLEIKQWLVDWVQECLEESHREEVIYHREQIDRLRSEYDKIQNRVDKLYLDKLDGIILEEYWEAKNQEFQKELSQMHDRITDHQRADNKYKQLGVEILNLSKTAYSLYLKQSSEEKRRLLEILLLNSSLKGGQITAELRKPFDMLRDINIDESIKKAPNPLELGASMKWRGIRDLKSRPPV